MIKEWEFTMLHRNSVIVLLLIVAFPFLAGAQSSETPNAKINDYLRSGGSFGLGLQTLGLLDPSRMTFQHSYSMSYMSSGNQGMMRGLFMETIGYRLSNPVTLTFNLGYLHQPYSSVGPDGIFQGGKFVGGAALDWRPTKNMFLHFEVANYPSYGVYNYDPFYRHYPYATPYSPFPTTEPTDP